MSKKPDPLTIVAQPQAFFQELIAETFGKLKVRVLPETEFYLVNLLNQFMSTENLYARDSSGNMKEEPLVFLLKDALEEKAAENKRVMFRHVGDVSLYTAGFFHDSLARKLVDVDYYIEMGGHAYQQTAVLTLEPAVKPVFSELSDRFPLFVDVLGEISEKTSPATEKDLLRIYDFWLKTQSARAERVLEKAGLIPSRKKPDLQ